MRFVSYSQNGEDVVLWRALHDIEGGFYIDVGANDPVEDSVTLAFYERGWRGMNIEPVREHFDDLVRARTRDINLCCAAGDFEGMIELWVPSIRGLASSSPDVKKQFTDKGVEGGARTVPVQTLSALCDQNPCDAIHFLKIDVEGAEEQVLAGLDLTRIRPWILLIEATRPNSTESNHEVWELDLLASGYLFAYTDGINRYYVANEHERLRGRLAYGPNILDNFVRSEQVWFEREAQRWEKVALTQIDRVRVLSEDLAEAQELALRKSQEVQALRSSSSWLVTAPLRLASRTLRSVLPACVKSRFRSGVIALADVVRRKTQLQRAVASTFARYPGLRARWHALIEPSAAAPGLASTNVGLALLPAGARRVLDELSVPSAGHVGRES